MSENINDFLVSLSQFKPLDLKHHQFLRECLQTGAKSAKYTKTPLTEAAIEALKKIVTAYPQHSDLINPMLPEEPVAPPALNWQGPQQAACDSDEGRPLQSVLRDEALPEGLCVWTGGVLSKEFGGHCGTPHATMDERTQVRRELGYGSMPKDKPSLVKTQPYCVKHLRASIQPARKANLDYSG